MIADAWSGVNGWWLAIPAIVFVVIALVCGSATLGRLVERTRMWFRSQ